MTRLVPWAVLVAVAVCLYYPSLDQPLTSYDDVRWLNDVQVRDSFRTMFDPRVRSDNPFSTSYYIPLQSALFYGMVGAFGRAPVPFHALGLAIHVAVTLLLFALARRLTRSEVAAFIAALFFVAHKGSVQSVTWVSAAYSHPLVCIFILGTVLAWHRHLENGSRPAYGVAVGLYAVGLLIRESAVITPVLLVALELLGTRRWSWRALVKYVPFAILTVALVALTIYKYRHGYVRTNWGGVSIGMHAVLRLLDFATLGLVPTDLAVAKKLILTAALLLGSFAILYRFRERPAWLFALLWLYLGLAPYTLANFNPAVFVTRYLYVGLLGLALLFAHALADAERWRPAWRHAAWGVAALVPLAHAFYTWKAVRG